MSRTVADIAKPIANILNNEMKSYDFDDVSRVIDRRLCEKEDIFIILKECGDIYLELDEGSSLYDYAAGLLLSYLYDEKLIKYSWQQ